MRRRSSFQVIHWDKLDNCRWKITLCPWLHCKQSVNSSNQLFKWRWIKQPCALRHADYILQQDAVPSVNPTETNNQQKLCFCTKLRWKFKVMTWLSFDSNSTVCFKSTAYQLAHRWRLVTSEYQREAHKIHLLISALNCQLQWRSK